jgi:MYXO-CTERM domain-containing protein
MLVQDSLVPRRNRFRCNILATAVLTTLAAGGLTRGAVISSTGGLWTPQGPIGRIGTGSISPLVATGNSFDVAVVGFNLQNSSGGYVVNDAAFLVGPYAPTFGVTATEPLATSDGETATITSTETAAGGKTTDKVTVTVPTAFVPSGSTFSDGDVINEEDLEIGFAAGTKALTFSVPVNTAITASGTGVYTYGGASHTYQFKGASAPYTELSTDHTMLSADEGLSNFTDTTGDTPADLTYLDLRSFSFTFSYATPAVPEPGTAGVGLAVAGAALMRRRSRNKQSPLVALETGLMEDPAARGL